METLGGPGGSFGCPVLLGYTKRTVPQFQSMEAERTEGRVSLCLSGFSPLQLKFV